MVKTRVQVDWIPISASNGFKVFILLITNRILSRLSNLYVNLISLNLLCEFEIQLCFQKIQILFKADSPTKSTVPVFHTVGNNPISFSLIPQKNSLVDPEGP